MNKFRSWEAIRRRQMKEGARRRGLKFNLSLVECRVLFFSNCYYCSAPRCGGIDRLNPKKDYEIENSVACCTNCNFILGDLPQEAKLELRDGLQKIYQKNLLESWEPAPIRASRAYNKRKKEEDKHVHTNI